MQADSSCDLTMRLDNPYGKGMARRRASRGFAKAALLMVGIACALAVAGFVMGLSVWFIASFVATGF